MQVMGIMSMISCQKTINNMTRAKTKLKSWAIKDSTLVGKSVSTEYKKMQINKGIKEWR